MTTRNSTRPDLAEFFRYEKYYYSLSQCDIIYLLTCSHSSTYRLQLLFFFLWRCDPTRVMANSFLMFLDHTQRRTTVGRTALDEWSARRRDLYLTTHNTHNRQTSMPPVGFEPTISAGDRTQTYALDRAATGTGTITITTDISTEFHQISQTLIN